jgi:hydrogenase maturation protease
MNRPRVLVAGVGNIFLGDDAFGVEVVRRLAQRPLPPEVRLIDFGIRGLDLAYALLDGYDLAVLVDAVSRGGTPGTLYVIEPDLDGTGDASAGRAVEAHGMDPAEALRLARALGGPQPAVRVVGCEPATLAPAEEGTVLSAPVEAAVEEAIAIIESLVRGWPEREASSCMNSGSPWRSSTS